MDFLDFQQTRQSAPSTGGDAIASLYYLSEKELHVLECKGGEYVLTIGNESYVSTDLDALDRVLYFYCCGESYFGDELQQREILRDNAIYACKKIDPKGAYTDLDCINDHVEPLGFNEALEQIITLTTGS